MMQTAQQDHLVHVLEVRGEQIESLRKSLKWIWISVGALIVSHVCLGVVVLSFMAGHP